MDTRRVLNLARLQSAPVVIGTVLALFLGGLSVTTSSSPVARLQRVLERLPSNVSVVLLPPSAPSRAERLAVSLLRLSLVSLPSRVRPAATLVVEADGRQRVLALVEVAAARAAGIEGPGVYGFTVAGDEHAAARLAAAIAGEDPRLPRILRQFLRPPAGSTELRLLLRPGVVLSALPRELQSSLGTDLVGLRLVDEGRELRVSGLAPRSAPPTGRSAPILGLGMDDALLVLDGIVIDDLLPSSLPPLLEALKAATGVPSELDALAKSLRDSPGVIILLVSAGERVDLVGGFLHPANIDSVATAARALLEKRLALHGAATEVVRAGGRTIRHRRTPRAAGPVSHRRAASGAGPVDGAPAALIEQERDGWRVSRAPHAAGTADLVAAWNGEAFLLGTSEDAVLRVAPHLRTVSGSLDLRFSLQVSRLRQLPVAPQVLAAFPPSVRTIVSTLEAAALELEPTASGIRFRGSARFAAP